jgi:hypothetical protein
VLKIVPCFFSLLSCHPGKFFSRKIFRDPVKQKVSRLFASFVFDDQYLLTLVFSGSRVRCAAASRHGTTVT